MARIAGSRSDSATWTHLGEVEGQVSAEFLFGRVDDANLPAIHEQAYGHTSLAEQAFEAGLGTSLPPVRIRVRDSIEVRCGWKFLNQENPFTCAFLAFEGVGMEIMERECRSQGFAVFGQRGFECLRQRRCA